MHTAPGPCTSQIFSWWIHHPGQSAQDHFLIYWVAPFVGALSAGLVFRQMFVQRAEGLGWRDPRAALPVAGSAKLGRAGRKRED